MAKAIEFHYMAESAPCRLVEIVADFAGVTLKKNYVNLFTGEHLKPEYLKINLRHRVPFIIDGSVKITESRAIACYLINKYMKPDNTLYPVEPTMRAKIDELLYIDAVNISQSSSALFYPIMRGKLKTFDQEAEKTFQDNIEFLDNHLNNGKKFLLGEQMTLADIAIMVSFQISECMEYEQLNKFKNVKLFLERVKASIPRYHEISDEPMENMKKFLKNKLNE